MRTSQPNIYFKVIYYKAELCIRTKYDVNMLSVVNYYVCYQVASLL